MQKLSSSFSVCCLGMALALATALFGFSAPALGQAVNATLLGTVTDSSGAPVGNVKITITETNTGISHNSQTNESGNYVLPDLPPGKPKYMFGGSESHGMAVTPDQKVLVVCSRLNNALYSYSLPDLKVIGAAELGGKGAGWVTLTPDGKTAYVANPVTNDVSVVDVKTMRETTRIPVGFVPKRNTTGVLQ